MQITVRQLKSLIREATALESKKIGVERVENLKQSLLELSNAIAELESEGFWDEFADEDAEEPDNSSEVWDEKIDAAIASLEAGDFGAVVAAAPELIRAAATVLDIFREEEDQLDKDVFWSAKRAKRALRDFVTLAKKLPKATNAIDARASESIT